MSKDSARADLAKLTDDEAEALTNDPQLMEKFKQKHGLSEPENGSPLQTLQAATSQSDPTQLLRQAAPSNLMKLAGVATANAPGMASTVLNSIPGMGSPAAIMPALQNVRANPRQGLQAIKRMADVSAGADLAPAEKLPAIAGQAAGTGLEMMIPNMGGGAPLGEQTAQRAGMSVMGVTKRFLKNDKMLDKYEQMSQTMLDKGVIKSFGSAQDTVDRVADLADKSGKRIGEILEKVDSGTPSNPGPSKSLGFPTATPQTKGRFFDPNRAIADLNELRPAGDDGQILRGGHYTEINQQIDKAIKTVQAHGGQPITLKTANQIKGLLQSGANFNNGKGAESLMDRLIAGRFRQSVDNQLDEAATKIGDPKLSQEFMEQKKLYAHAQAAKDPIFNRISSELGNKNIGLTDWIAMAPDLALGNPLKALVALGGKRALESFGPSTTAVVANKIAKLRIPTSSVNNAQAVSALGDSLASRKQKITGK